MDTSHTPPNGKNRHSQQVRFPKGYNKPIKKLGFSLIEVLIAVSIMLGGMMVVRMVTSGNSMRFRKTVLNNNVSTLLERKITEIEAKFEGKPLTQIPEEDSGDFGSDFKQYRWIMKSQDFEMPDLSSVLISRREGADDTLLTVMKQTQEFISKSVKEVTISVFVKTPVREIEYAITTYFVSYEEDLAFGGGG